MSNETNQTQPSEIKGGNKPDWVVKAARGYGRNSRLERIGVAWSRTDSGICIRLVGKQVVDGDIYLYPVTEEAAEGDAQ